MVGRGGGDRNASVLGNGTSYVFSVELELWKTLKTLVGHTWDTHGAGLGIERKRKTVSEGKGMARINGVLLQAGDLTHASHFRAGRHSISLAHSFAGEF